MRRQGFTLIELIFSIVVLAIIAAIGAEIISRVYERYAATRDMERAQSDLRRTLDIIAARLSYRVKNSAVARDLGASVDNPDSVKPAYQPEDPTSLSYWNLQNYEMLQWVGIAYESWRGRPYVPGGGVVTDAHHVLTGWSAIGMRVTDSNASAPLSSNTFYSPLSNLGRVASPMEETLTGDPDPFGVTSDSQTVLVFAGRDWRGETPAGTVDNVTMKHVSWGWGTAAAGHSRKSYFKIGLFPVGDPQRDQNFTVAPIDPSYGTPIAGYPDHPPSFSGANNLPNYYLVRSAYSLWVENGDLTLAYNFRPWLNQQYDYADAKKQILLRDVTSFLFQESGDVFRLRLCVKASDWVAGANDDNATQFCRERTVL
jgi:prepilin-type N-terminal cleavage/methylation domain-containing protein